MPRTIREAIDQAEALAIRFEHHDPDEDAIHGAEVLRAVRHAVLSRAEAERVLADAIAKARQDGHSWTSIGAMVGTSGDAARRRYGRAW